MNGELIKCWGALAFKEASDKRDSNGMEQNWKSSTAWKVTTAAKESYFSQMFASGGKWVCFVLSFTILETEKAVKGVYLKGPTLRQFSVLLIFHPALSAIKYPRSRSDLQKSRTAFAIHSPRNVYFMRNRKIIDLTQTSKGPTFVNIPPLTGWSQHRRVPPSLLGK